jgi:hypothetical protein
MRQFNVLQLLIPAPYSPVLLKEWLPNADDVIKAVKKKVYITCYRKLHHSFV